MGGATFDGGPAHLLSPSLARCPPPTGPPSAGTGMTRSAHRTTTRRITTRRSPRSRTRRPARADRPLRSYAPVAAAGLVSLLGLGYLTQSTPVEATGCAIGLDAYGSAKELTGYYIEWIERIAPECVTSEGSALMAFPIHGGTLSGQQAWLKQSQLNLIDDPKHDTKVIQSAVAGFIDDVRNRVLTDSGPRGGTDIIAAATVAARSFTPAQHRKTVVLFTDAINASAGYPFVGKKAINLTTPESRAQVLDSLAAKNLIPDLSGATVKIYGANDTTFDVNAELLQSIEAFWRDFFDRAGAHLTDYSPTPPTR